MDEVTGSEQAPETGAERLPEKAPEKAPETDWRGFRNAWVASTLTQVLVVVPVRLLFGLVGWMTVLTVMYGLTILPLINLLVLGRLALLYRPRGAGRGLRLTPWERRLAGLYFIGQAVVLAFMVDATDTPDHPCPGGAMYPVLLMAGGCRFAEVATGVVVVGGLLLMLAAYVGLRVLATRRVLRRRRELRGRPAEATGTVEPGTDA